MSMFSADAYVYLIAGLALMGAAVVALVPFVLRQRRARRSSARAGAQSAEVEQKPPWRKKRDIVRQTRDYLRKVRVADGAPGAAGGDTSGSPKRGEVSSSVAAASAALPAGKAAPPQGGGSPPEAKATPLAHAEGVPDAEETGDGRRTDSVLGAFSEKRREPDDLAALLEEDDDSKENDQELGDVFGGKASGKSGDPDSLFELFTAETAEDSDVAKLAASLEDVDTRDLLAEAQQVLNEVRGVAEAWRRRTHR